MFIFTKRPEEVPSACCHVVVLRPCAVRLPLPQTHPYAGAYFRNELAPMRSSLSYN